MAKKKGKPEASQAESKAEIVYSFPSRSRCPRCGSLETERYSSDGALQYRRCKVVTCRKTYRVVGTAV